MTRPSKVFSFERPITDKRKLIGKSVVQGRFVFHFKAVQLTSAPQANSAVMIIRCIHVSSIGGGMEGEVTHKAAWQHIRGR